MSGERKYLANLDLLRIIAAYFVLLFHFRWEGDDYLTYIYGFGYLGVYVFFAISGFITPLAMQWSGYTLGKWRQFLVSRFFRLYPAFLAIAVFQIAQAAWGVYFEEVTWSRVFSNFTWTADFFGEDWFVPVFWTLAIEAQFTLLILFIYPLLNHKSQWVSVLVVLVMIGANYFAGRGITIMNYSGIFVMGVLVYLYYIKKLGFLLFMPLLALAYYGYATGVSSWHARTAVGTALFVAFVPQLYAGWIKYLGRFAYSFFLLHIPFGAMARNYLGFFPDDWYYQGIKVFIVGLVSFLVSWVFYYKIEKPSHDFSRRFKR